MNFDGMSRYANDQSPSWSPDGQRIAFISGRDSDPNDFEIYTVDPDIGLSSIHRITVNGVGEYSPSWSPDGQSLVYHGSVIDDAGVGRGTDIFIIDTTGQNRQRIISEVSNKVWPTWSLDGTRIAFVWQHALYVMNADGSDMRRLTEGLEVRWQPQWR